MSIWRNAKYKKLNSNPNMTDQKWFVIFFYPKIKMEEIKMLKNYKSFELLEQYLSYLTVIKGRSINTVIEYSTDVLIFQFVRKNSL